MAFGKQGLNGLGAEYFDLVSRSVDDTFRIFVAKPWFSAGAGLPVVYALDRNGSFPLLMAMHTGMMIERDVPPALIVGIGYASAEAMMVNRGRDYTPTPVTDMRSVPHAGGPEFLQFLVEELIPVIDAHYPVESDNRILAGHSIAGLFGAWVMLTQPSLFRGYMLSSPSFDTNHEEVWEWESDFASSGSRLDATVYVSAGGLEDDGRARLMEQAGQGSDAEKLAEIVRHFEMHGWPRGQRDTVPEFVDRVRARGYAGLEIAGDVFAGETHMSVLPGALSRGLRYVLGGWRPD